MQVPGTMAKAEISGTDSDSLLMTPLEQEITLEEQAMVDHPHQVCPDTADESFRASFAQLLLQRTNKHQSSCAAPSPIAWKGPANCNNSYARFAAWRRS